MTKPGHSFVEDSIWRPLVHVLPDHQAFLVIPGTTIPATHLKPGWHWHWPLLTSIRQVHFDPITFTFSASDQVEPNSINDEAIIAVSLDHHLFTIQGSITLQLNRKAPMLKLAEFSRHSNNRLIRPYIRQFIRQAVAVLPAERIDSNSLGQLLTSQPTKMFSDYGVLVNEISISTVSRFTPLFLKQKLW